MTFKTPFFSTDIYFRNRKRLGNKAMVVLSAPILLCLACTPRAELEAKLKTQASLDLSCPERDITVDETDPNEGVWMAIGCNDYQSYVHICQNFACDFVQGDSKTSRAMRSRRTPSHSHKPYRSPKTQFGSGN